jgi:hypothetical protein
MTSAFDRRGRCHMDTTRSTTVRARELRSDETSGKGTRRLDSQSAAIALAEVNRYLAYS